MSRRFTFVMAGASALAGLLLACGDSTSPSSADRGTVVVKLTDAPFLTDSVKSVDIFVVRVEGRVADADSATADSNLDAGAATGWQVLASPNAAYNVLALHNGATVTLGTTAIPAGTYSGFRFIIDPSQSSVTLKNGMILTGTSSPSVTFPSASRSGIKIQLTTPCRSSPARRRRCSSTSTSTTALSCVATPSPRMACCSSRWCGRPSSTRPP
jgi:hypothetical protein